MPGSERPTTYRDAGVDIDAGERLVRRIAPAAKRTARRGADGALGGFGGLFDLAASGYRDPILVAATDGVGTKLRLAIEIGAHGGVGVDLVAMCVNDLVVQAAEPLFFLDYFACGALDVEHAAAVVEGIADGCRIAGCALIGGETAEMPGMYAAGDYDLAGFAVGAVERTHLLPRRDIAPGDALIALPSSGLHSNGFSLVRRIIARLGLDLGAAAPFQPGATLGAVLLTPTRIYVRPLLELIETHRDAVKALAHITGGGLTGNVPRVLPNGLSARVALDRLPSQPVFDWLRAAGPVADDEMLRTFNCGVGMVLVVAADAADAVIETLLRLGESPVPIGETAAGERRVLYEGTMP